MLLAKPQRASCLTSPRSRQRPIPQRKQSVRERSQARCAFSWVLLREVQAERLRTVRKVAQILSRKQQYERDLEPLVKLIREITGKPFADAPGRCSVGNAGC